MKKVPVPGQLICRMCLPFFQEEPGEMLGLTSTKSSAAENGDEGQADRGVNNRTERFSRKFFLMFIFETERDTA